MTAQVPAVPDPSGGLEPHRPPVVGDGLERYDLLWRVAQRIAGTSMVPKGLRGDAHEVLAVMAYGDELGIGPMAALRSIHMIEGVPTCSAQLMRGLIQGAGHRVDVRELTDDRVTLYGRRRDTGSAALITWTIDDAKRAKLTGRGNWGTYPRAMLAARATTELARLLFADVLHGLAYTPEEVGAVGPLDAIDVTYTPGGVDVETGEIIDGEQLAAEEAEVQAALDADQRYADDGDGLPFEEAELP